MMIFRVRCLTFEMRGMQRRSAVACPLDGIRRDFPPSSNGVETPRLSCVHQSETEKGEIHERDYTSADRAGRCGPGQTSDPSACGGCGGPPCGVALVQARAVH